MRDIALERFSINRNAEIPNFITTLLVHNDQILCIFSSNNFLILEFRGSLFSKDSIEHKGFHGHKFFNTIILIVARYRYFSLY